MVWQLICQVAQRRFDRRKNDDSPGKRALIEHSVPLNLHGMKVWMAQQSRRTGEFDISLGLQAVSRRIRKTIPN
jgi:hypothetical protein